MAMLMIETAPFSIGRASFKDFPSVSAGSSARILVRVAVHGLDDPFLCLLDTGAEYSVIAPEIAAEAGLPAGDGETITIRHKDGTTQGTLVRTTMTLFADEGDALDVDATVFVANSEWPTGRNVIGYGGFLERIRLGLDPQANDIYFGGY